MSDVTADLTTAGGLAERLDDVQVVDCREPYEWQAGRIAGSIHIPLNTLLSGAIGDLDTGKTTVAVCRSGSRSELATLMLQARGFEAYNLGGGLEVWEAEGHPLTTPEGEPGRVV